MSTNKLKVQSLAAKLRGADNWLDPVATYADLPAGATEGDSVMVYADPVPSNNGIYLRQNGQWEFAPGGSGGDIPPYVTVIPAGGNDVLASALAALPSSGGTIFLQEGLHTLTSALPLIDKSNVRIMGVGPASRLRVLSPAAASIITVGGAGPVEHIEISHLTLETDASATEDAYLIDVADTASHVRLRHLSVQGYGHFPIRCAGSHVTIEHVVAEAAGILEQYRFLVLMPTASYVTVRQNTVIDFPVFLFGSAGAQQVLVEGNIWVAPTTNLENPYFCLGQGSTDLTLIGNTAVTTDTGTVTHPVIDLIDGPGSGQILIAGNRLRSRYGVRIALTDSLVQVLDNHFRSCLEAIQVSGTGGVSVSGNRVHAAVGTSVLVDVNCPYADVANNLIVGSGQTGLVVRAANTMVSGNRLINEDVGSPADAIQILTTSTDNTVVVNNITNRPISDLGTNTVQANNTVLG